MLQLCVSSPHLLEGPCSKRAVVRTEAACSSLCKVHLSRLLLLNDGWIPASSSLGNTSVPFKHKRISCPQLSAALAFTTTHSAQIQSRFQKLPRRIKPACSVAACLMRNTLVALLCIATGIGQYADSNLGSTQASKPQFGLYSRLTAVQAGMPSQFCQHLKPETYAELPS